MTRIQSEPRSTRVTLLLRQNGVVAIVAARSHDILKYRLPDSRSMHALVRSRLKGHGPGWLLMQRVIDYANQKGLRQRGNRTRRRQVRVPQRKLKG
jgi:hypothetical protein